jgi:hypothetical protein
MIFGEDQVQFRIRSRIRIHNVDFRIRFRIHNNGTRYKLSVNLTMKSATSPSQSLMSKMSKCQDQMLHIHVHEKRTGTGISVGNSVKLSDKRTISLKS